MGETELKLTIQRFGGEETIVHQAPLGESLSDGSFRSNVLSEPGIIRLRLRAGDSASESPPGISYLEKSRYQYKSKKEQRQNNRFSEIGNVPIF